MKFCKVMKSAKKGNSSFRITLKLLNTLYKKSRRVHKKAKLILTIPLDESYNFVLDCTLKKEKK